MALEKRGKVATSSPARLKVICQYEVATQKADRIAIKGDGSSSAGNSSLANPKITGMVRTPTRAETKRIAHKLTPHRAKEKATR